MLAAVGVYAVGSRVWGVARPGWLVLAVGGLFTLGLARTAYTERGALQPCWRAIERIAQRVNSVTPGDGLIYGGESIYFAARRAPPRGLENGHALGLRLPAELSARLGVVPEKEVIAWLAGGRFATVVVGDYELHKVGSAGLLPLYARREQLHDNCYVGNGYILWERVPPSHDPR